MSLHALVYRFRDAYRAGLLRAAHVELGRYCRLGRGIDVSRGLFEGKNGRIAIGSYSTIGQGVILHAYGGKILIETGSHIGPYCVIYGHGGVSIGKDCLISPQCSIFSSNHAVPPQDRKIRDMPDRRLPVKIGDGAWIGAGSRILGGVTIGEGAVIGAGAVVTKDVPPFAIAHGVPARVVGTREESSS